VVDDKGRFQVDFDVPSAPEGNYNIYFNAVESRYFLTATFKVTPAGPPDGSVILSGKVVDANGNGIPGVTIRETDAASGELIASTETDTDGVYHWGDQSYGTYTVTPSKQGYTFSPDSRKVTLPPNATGVNFTATKQATGTGGNQTIRYPFTGSKSWKIKTGYNAPPPSDHTPNGYQRYAFDVVTESGSPVGEEVVAPATGTIAWMDPNDKGIGMEWSRNDPNCMAISIKNHQDFFIVTCHVKFNKIYKHGDGIQQGVPIGTVGPQDARSSEPHIHIALYQAKSAAAGPAERTPIPFADPWQISGCNYPSNGQANQYQGVGGLPQTCPTTR